MSKATNSDRTRRCTRLPIACALRMGSRIKPFKRAAAGFLARRALGKLRADMHGEAVQAYALRHRFQPFRRQAAESFRFGLQGWTRQPISVNALQVAGNLVEQRQ